MSVFSQIDNTLYSIFSEVTVVSWPEVTFLTHFKCFEVPRLISSLSLVLDFSFHADMSLENLFATTKKQTNDTLECWRNIAGFLSLLLLASSWEIKSYTYLTNLHRRFTASGIHPCTEYTFSRHNSYSLQET